MEIKRLYNIIRISMMRNGYKRAAYLKKKNFFAEQGENCSYTSLKLPQEAKLIKMGNSVVVGSEVLFITHDTIYKVLKDINEDGNYCLELGPIEIGDNVYIGSRAIILPNVKVGSNVIIGAGSIVTSDVKDGNIVGGVPAKKIGEFDNILEERENSHIERRRKVERFPEEWNKFYKSRGI